MTSDSILCYELGIILPHASCTNCNRYWEENHRTKSLPVSVTVPVSDHSISPSWPVAKTVQSLETLEEKRVCLQVMKPLRHILIQQRAFHTDQALPSTWNLNLEKILDSFRYHAACQCSSISYPFTSNAFQTTTSTLEHYPVYVGLSHSCCTHPKLQVNAAFAEDFTAQAYGSRREPPRPCLFSKGLLALQRARSKRRIQTTGSIHFNCLIRSSNLTSTTSSSPRSSQCSCLPVTSYPQVSLCHPRKQPWLRGSDNPDLPIQSEMSPYGSSKRGSKLDAYELAADPDSEPISNKAPSLHSRSRAVDSRWEQHPSTHNSRDSTRRFPSSSTPAASPPQNPDDFLSTRATFGYQDWHSNATARPHRTDSSYPMQDASYYAPFSMASSNPRHQVELSSRRSMSASGYSAPSTNTAYPIITNMSGDIDFRDSQPQQQAFGCPTQSYVGRDYNRGQTTSAWATNQVISPLAPTLRSPSGSSGYYTSNSPNLPRYQHHPQASAALELQVLNSPLYTPDSQFFNSPNSTAHSTSFTSPCSEHSTSSRYCYQESPVRSVVINASMQ